MQKYPQFACKQMLVAMLDRLKTLRIIEVNNENKNIINDSRIIRQN